MTLIFSPPDAPLAAQSGVGGNMLGAFLKKGDVISGAVLAALGVFIITQSRAWDYYTLDGPGPGFFPFWYGVAMVVLSLLLIVSSARNGDDGISKGVDWPATGRAMMTWLAFAVSVALMNFLGFLISFALLAFFLVTVIFRRPVITAAVVAVTSALAFHLIFPVALSVSLPTGPFGF
jgi:putative tricarboxylic transport membrane protein